MSGVCSRRALLTAGALMAVAGCAERPGYAQSRDDDVVLDPAQAWARLAEGNRRWAAGRPVHPHSSADRRHRVAPAQKPFAVVVSCIDSRVPPETVFDQGIGDLFAVRTGGAALDDLVTASVEYGPIEAGTPLIVVLGHERCGAVTAAVRALRDGEAPPGHLGHLVRSLRPAYEAARGLGGDLVAETIRAQVLRTTKLLAADTALAPMIAAGRLDVMGALYALDSGEIMRLP